MTGREKSTVANLRKNLQHFVAVSGGAGLQFANPLRGDLMWTLGAELREKNYRTDSTRRTIRQQNGKEIGYATTLTYLLTQVDSITLGVSVLF